jgi:hypothetical protein
MRKALWRRRPDLWASGQWTFLHDNVRSHTALSVNRFLAKHEVTVLQHPPYSPDLSPCDFFLFPQLKKTLEGRWHENIKAIQVAATMELTAIPIEAFTSCIQDLPIRWQQCTDCRGGLLWRGQEPLVNKLNFVFFTLWTKVVIRVFTYCIITPYNSHFRINVRRQLHIECCMM